jgi:hypothetical protein
MNSPRNERIPYKRSVQLKKDADKVTQLVDLYLAFFTNLDLIVGNIQRNGADGGGILKM